MSGSAVVEDPASLTKERLKSELLAHKVALPTGEQKKEVYVKLYLKHVTPKRSGVRARAGLRADFSSDEEEQQPPRASPNRMSSIIIMLVALLLIFLCLCHRPKTRP